jgi:tripartite-type tricarboxylate transporter receptor subunit TctC
MLRRICRAPCLAAIGFGLLVALMAAKGPAAAQGDYPSRTVRIIVPATPGGGSDTFARLVAQHLAKELNQQFVVENRPGGGTLPALEYVASQPADGYTLYLSPSTTTSMHLVRKSMPWDVRKMFTGLTQLAVVPQGLVINPKVPARSVKEYIALAKREPGKLTYGSAGPGTGPHMAMELFNLMAGIKVQHVPYRGVSQSVTDILGGSINGMMLNLVTAKPHIEAGQLRILGISSLKRSSAMPEVPTIAEVGVPGYEALQWFGLLARAGTPPEILNRLQKLIAAGMQTPEMQERLKTEGADAVVNTPDEFQKVIGNEIERWTKLAKAINLKPE